MEHQVLAHYFHQPEALPALVEVRQAAQARQAQHYGGLLLLLVALAALLAHRAMAVVVARVLLLVQAVGVAMLV